MSELEYFDPNEVIQANHTPIFKASQVNYQPADTPPPLVLDDTSEESAGARRRSGGRSRSAGKRRRQTHPSEAEAVLIRETAPNYPEIARDAHLNPLGSASQSEDEGDDDDDEEEEEAGGEREASTEPMHGVRNGDPVPDRITSEHSSIVETAERALKHVRERPDVDMIDHAAFRRDDERRIETRSETQDSRPSTGNADQTSPLPKVQLDVKPPPRLPQISTSMGTSRSTSNDDHDSIITSPALAKYAIKEGDPENVLPAMQTSPRPRSSSAQSPESGGQTLPSIKAALSQVSDPGNNGISYHSTSSTHSHSPSMTRPSPGQHLPSFGPSPASYSHPSPTTNGMSPPGMPGHRSFNSWPHVPTRDGSHSTNTPSEYTSSHSQSTPNSAITIPSPANSYPTPISAHQRQDSDGSTPQANGLGSPPANGPLMANNSFKCTYLGCNAPPFQTQYLLNSHANVHSSSRPHFCPVAGCNRGPGGKGFKRKNEMIRHGLVHESPGYQCPFCPDQTHKYPRPDNLQRHVRVHHVDKDRDDPLLRRVLAQRPEGPNRGRRRRI